VALADEGPGYRRLRPGEGTRYGSATLLQAIERAAAEVAEVFPGGYPLRIGDLSGPSGGTHPRHRSHRSGRDADALFFVKDAGGLPAPNDAWMRFDRFGWAVSGGRAFELDDGRNWHFVRTLVLDDRARVKWIFCSNEVKARLLRYAVRHEPSPSAVLRATWVLHQPSAGDPHDDHFHIRVGCNQAERALGCQEEPPHWPWLNDPARKEQTLAGAAASDDHLVRWLLAEQHVDQRGDVVRGGLGAAQQPAFTARR
jgi:penicillin-insensitive murein endopeptidase